MERIIKILMDRDDMSREEAIELINDVKEMMQKAIEDGSYMEAEEIFEDELGLEPDYIFDILW